jgi:hypothetical protein
VIRRPLDALITEHQLAWVIFDFAFTDPARVGVDGMVRLVLRRGQFGLYRVIEGERERAC